MPLRLPSNKLPVGALKVSPEQLPRRIRGFSQVILKMLFILKPFEAGFHGGGYCVDGAQTCLVYAILGYMHCRTYRRPTIKTSAQLSITTILPWNHLHLLRVFNMAIRVPRHGLQDEN